MTYKEYLRLKDIDDSETTKEKAFRYGQATVIALIADYLGMSVSWERWDRALERMFDRTYQGTNLSSSAPAP